MSNSSDKVFDQYQDMDFANAKPVHETPLLANLQAARGGKTRITMRVDSEVLALYVTKGMEN